MKPRAQSPRTLFASAVLGLAVIAPWSLGSGCECTPNLTVEAGRFCASDSWKTSRSSVPLRPIVDVSRESVIINYAMGGAVFQVHYDVKKVKTLTGSCPDKTETYLLKRTSILRAGGGPVPTEEDTFWAADAELRAESYGVGEGINALYIGDSRYYLSNTYCPLLADDDNDGGSDDAGEEDPFGCIPTNPSGSADASLGDAAMSSDASLMSDGG